MASCWEVAILGGDSDRSQQMQLLECSRSGGAGQQLTPALAHWHIRDHSSRQHRLTLTLWAHMALCLPALHMVLTQQQQKSAGAHRQQPFLSIIKFPFCYMLCA